MEAIGVIIALVIIAVITLTVIKDVENNQGNSSPGGTDAPKNTEPLDPNVKPE
jgi:hypothetical protein